MGDRFGTLAGYPSLHSSPHATSSLAFSRLGVFTHKLVCRTKALSGFRQSHLYYTSTHKPLPRAGSKSWPMAPGSRGRGISCSGSGPRAALSQLAVPWADVLHPFWAESPSRWHFPLPPVSSGKLSEGNRLRLRRTSIYICNPQTLRLGTSAPYAIPSHLPLPKQLKCLAGSTLSSGCLLSLLSQRRKRVLSDKTVSCGRR